MGPASTVRPRGQLTGSRCLASGGAWPPTSEGPEFGPTPRPLIRLHVDGSLCSHSLRRDVFLHV